MIRQQVKDLYYTLTRVAVLPNHYLARLRYRRPPDSSGFYIHLACGEKYIPGMINTEGNILRKKDLWMDLRNGLPFPDRSGSLIYCSHTLEHLFPNEAIDLLREMRRVLMPDGVARIAVPSMEHALMIASGTASATFPRQFEDQLAQALNYLFCDGQHKYGYSFALLSDFARQAGFGHVNHYSREHGIAPRQYGPFTVGDESPGSLVVELMP